MWTGFHRIRIAAAVLTLALASSAAKAGPATRERVAAALPQIGALAQKLIDDGSVPGLSIAVVYHDEIIYLKGFGLRETGRPERVDADTVFQIASLSKPVSSTIIAALVGAGKLGWDSKIADLDPGFRLSEPYPTVELTLTDLLAHRSGLPGEAGNELEAIGYDRGEILRRLRLVKPASSFRAGYSYSNFGFTEAGVAAARPTGTPWENVAEAMLYRPLGMNATSSRYSDFVSRSNRAELHIPVEGKWRAKIKRDPDAQAPAGGVSSNARDLAQWMRLELANGKFEGRQLIGSEALAATHAPLIERGKNPISGASSFYGLGWGVEFGRHGLEWSHAGAFSVGARTLAKLNPEAGLGVVVLANAFPTGAPEGIAESLFDLVFDGGISADWTAKWTAFYASIYDPAIKASTVYARPPASAAPALPLASYLGAYANDYVGEAIVARDRDGLRLELGPKRKRFALKHFDRDRFLFRLAEEVPALSSLTFEIGPGQKAIQATIEDFNAIGLGRLRRVGD